MNCKISIALNADTADASGGYFTHGDLTAFDSFSVSSSTISSIELEMSEYLSDISVTTIELGIWTGITTGNIFSQTFDLSTSSLASYSLITAGDYDLFSISLDITDVVLDGSYWLSVHTTGLNGGGLLIPYVSDPVSGDDQFQQYYGQDNTAYLRTGQELSFELYSVDPVPEPATMFLFGIGLLGLAGVSRKK